MKDCRNCGSADVVELGPIGLIAPFFLKRVFGIEMRIPVSRSPFKQTVRVLFAPVKALYSKLFSKQAYLEMQICTRCSFIQAKNPFPEDWITRLYLDYRSETYNRERIQYEPSYAALAPRVGVSTLEVSERLKAATRFLTGKLDITPDFTMLDYGGADGRFLPDLAPRRFVYEISDIAPIAGIQRIASEEELGLYSYVHLAHVLEHVVYPLKMVERVSKLIEPRGYLYLEVPQELDEQTLQKLKQGSPGIEIGIHEHINSFSISAVQHLMAKAGLEVVGIESTTIEVGWAKAVHIRALGRKA